jgi:hypothetical protein
MHQENPLQEPQQIEAQLRRGPRSSVTCKEFTLYHMNNHDPEAEDHNACFVFFLLTISPSPITLSASSNCIPWWW